MSTGVFEHIWDRLIHYGDLPAVYQEGQVFSYSRLVERIGAWEPVLNDEGISRGSIVAVEGDYSLETCSLLWALMKRGSILVPLSSQTSVEFDTLLELAGAQFHFRLDRQDNWQFTKRKTNGTHDLIKAFRERGTFGLIVFTSGSTGKPKGILHDGSRLLSKFAEPRKGWRTVMLLLFDHFGGFNTFLSVFCNGGQAVCVPLRNPEFVSRAIEQSKANLLPASPTFLNWLIRSGCHRTFDLSSIELVTYGTEVMPEALLQTLREQLPQAKFKQTYGLSELGVLRSTSKEDGSLWVRLGGLGFETEVREGVLWVRAESNMVGYLNEKSPFDGDGWMCTGDVVDVQGDYMRILGRKSDVINVGGQKVFPSEVESVLLKAGNVKEAWVMGRPHSLLGQAVHARVVLDEAEDTERASERLRRYCLSHLSRYKVPVKFEWATAEEAITPRLKKRRTEEGARASKNL